MDTIVHFATSGLETAEQDPDRFMLTDMHGIENAFDVAILRKCRLFVASSIAVYAGNPAKEKLAEDASLLPTSIYGVGKVYAEQLVRYYSQKMGLDFRCLRYPVVVSSSRHGYVGAARYTTDMFVHALAGKKYECYANPDARVPVIHIDDCIDATVRFRR